MRILPQNTAMSFSKMATGPIDEKTGDRMDITQSASVSSAGIGDIDSSIEKAEDAIIRREWNRKLNL